ncbi:MAG: Gfo/Idh/MocA family protein, partial [Anaerolineales bacterium]
MVSHTPMSPVTAVLIGAGNRGAEAYGPYALRHPDEIGFVAVAEPRPERRARFAAEHQIPPERQYPTWEALLASGVGKLADAALICTPDQLHVAPAMAAMALGYEVLLEKPMATSLADCLTLTRAAEAQGRLLQICHVLRYTPFFSTLHEIVTSGRLGKVITVEHRENVAYWHMAHSYVRGNWRNRAAASPMILAKCCHDLDILFWNLGPCARLSSFGSLIHYREENAPPGAPARCLDGCPVAETCPWYAPRLYLDLTPLRHNAPDQAIPEDYAGWPRSVIAEDLSPAGLRRALETGPYGRCIYHCDNDVVDHQVVNMEMGMAGGPSVALTMHGHSHREGRAMRYDGTRATLRGCYYADEQRIEIHDHLTGEVEVLRPDLHPASGSGHGGGDVGLMAAFVRAVRDPATALTTARSALESHLMAFAADEARRTG